MSDDKNKALTETETENDQKPAAENRPEGLSLKSRIIILAGALLLAVLVAVVFYVVFKLLMIGLTIGLVLFLLVFIKLKRQDSER